MSEVPGSILGADVEFSFFFLVEKNLMTVKTFLSVAKMAPTVYETETCDSYTATQSSVHYSGLVALFALIFALTCRVCKIRCAHAHYLVMTL